MQRHDALARRRLTVDHPPTPRPRGSRPAYTHTQRAALHAPPLPLLLGTCSQRPTQEPPTRSTQRPSSTPPNARPRSQPVVAQPAPSLLPPRLSTPSSSPSRPTAGVQGGSSYRQGGAAHSHRTKVAPRGDGTVVVFAGAPPPPYAAAPAEALAPAAGRTAVAGPQGSSGRGRGRWGGGVRHGRSGSRQQSRPGGGWNGARRRRDGLMVSRPL